jgi:hypothetical protein
MRGDGARSRETPSWWTSLERRLEAVPRGLSITFVRYRIPVEDAEAITKAVLDRLEAERDGPRDAPAWVAAATRAACAAYWRERRASEPRWTRVGELVAQLAGSSSLGELIGEGQGEGEGDVREGLIRVLEEMPEPWADIVRRRIVAGCGEITSPEPVEREEGQGRREGGERPRRRRGR